MCRLVQSEQQPTVDFSAKALDVMYARRQLQRSQVEAGGILIGRFYPAKNLIIVECATRPGYGDVGTRKTWRRDPLRAMRLANLANLRDSSLHYVGEWHTHPEKDPRPSTRDIETLIELESNSTIVAKGLVFAIQGTADLYKGFQMGGVLRRLG